MLKDVIDAATKHCPDRLARNFTLQAPSSEEIWLLDSLRSECRVVNQALLADLRKAALNVPNLTVQCTIVLYLKEIRAIPTLSEIVTHSADSPLGDMCRGVALCSLVEIDKQEGRNAAKRILTMRRKPSKFLRYTATQVLHPHMGWFFGLFIR